MNRIWSPNHAHARCFAEYRRVTMEVFVCKIFSCMGWTSPFVVIDEIPQVHPVSSARAAYYSPCPEEAMAVVSELRQGDARHFDVTFSRYWRRSGRWIQSPLISIYHAPLSLALGRPHAITVLILIYFCFIAHETITKSSFNYGSSVRNSMLNLNIHSYVYS